MTADFRIHWPYRSVVTDRRRIDGALAHTRRTRALHIDAPARIDASGLDPALYLPGNIWADLVKPDSAFEWNETTVAFARCASPFSGFQLVVWARQDAPGSFDPAVAREIYSLIIGGAPVQSPRLRELFAAKETAARIRQEGLWLIGSWRTLTKRVPRRYVVALPAVGGESGVLYKGRIINPDLLAAQSRINALYGSGALRRIENAIARDGSAYYLEIGAGCGLFARALYRCFEGKLRVHIIDLPSVLGNAAAYLSLAEDPESISIVDDDDAPDLSAPFVLIPNYVAPRIADRLPRYHLVHNALSMNEMTEAQVKDYLSLIAEHLAEEGVFHLAQGGRTLDYHVDAQRLASEMFPHRMVYDGGSVGRAAVIETPNSFYSAHRRFRPYAPFVAMIDDVRRSVRKSRRTSA